MIKSLRRTGIIAVLLLLLLCSQVYAFKFAVMGDIQGGDEILQAIISQINARNDISFLVQTGDMCPRGTTAEYEHYLGIFKTVNIPVKHACGNHDRATDPGFYEKYIGKAYYSWDYEDCHFTVFDNSKDLLEKEQQNWLEKDLTGSSAKHKYVFAHKPVYSPYCKHCMGEWNPLAKEQVPWLEELFSKSKVTMAFSGHIHAYRDGGLYKGVHYYVTGGGGARLYHVPQYQALYHYLIVDTDTGKVEMIPIKDQKP
jgi:3',5'-cyclic AMP phosphodiesterase CpdA